MTRNAPTPQAVSGSAPANRAPAMLGNSDTLILEVGRGRTEHPRRPVLKDRFLIGSAPECDLRLGGDTIPALHSILYRDGVDVWLDAVAANPPLRVNGTATTSARLQDGDRVEIGTFQLTVRRSAAVPSTPEQEQPGNSSASAAAVPENVDDLSAVSAAELVSLFEYEIQEAEQFEQRRQIGAAALLQAVSARRSNHDRLDSPQQGAASGSRDAAPTTSAPHLPQELAVPPIDPVIGKATDPRIVEEIYRVVQGLNEFSQQLERRADQLTQQEASYATAASVLLDAQLKLSDQLKQLQDQVAALEAAKDSLEPPRRAVA